MKNLTELIESRDIPRIKEYMKTHNLKLEGNKIVPANDDVKKEYKEQSEFWNQRQQAR